MKRKIFIVVTFIGISLSLVGCSSIADTINSITNPTIDVTYGLDTNTFDSYISDSGNDTVVNAAIALSSTVEVTVDFEYSYTQVVYTPFGSSSKNVSGSAESLATAFFINADGYLMTNAHVVTLEDYESLSNFTYDSVDVKINYADSNTTFPADIITYDQSLDLAILKVDPTLIDNLQYLTFYDLTDPDASLYNTTDAIKLFYGEPVIAVGNANGYGLSVSSGVVSAPLRYFDDNGTIVEAIQTDTAVNSGNSGGPLLNKYGYVVGIISFKVVAEGTENLGYAIPSYVMMKYIDSQNLNITYQVAS
ncbi:MAG: S1C family serine protease [Acholeplasmataceae bacterium]